MSPDDNGHNVSLTVPEAAPLIIAGSSSLVANTAIIAAEALRPSKQETIILPPETYSVAVKEMAQGPKRDYSKAPGAAVVDSNFRLIFKSVVALTVFSGLAEIIMAFGWPSPTELQHMVFLAMDFAWKAGFGAILGLLGAKQT